MTSPTQGHPPENQEGLDTVSSSPNPSQSQVVSGGVQEYVAGLFSYLDAEWVQMAGIEWKLRIIDILKEIGRDPAKYKTFKLTIRTGNDFLDEDSSVSMLSASGGVDHAAGAIMGELRKMRYFHPGLKIHIKSIELME